MMYGQGYGYGAYGDMMGGLGGWLFLLFGLLVLAGIVLLVVWAARSMRSGQHHPASPAIDDACTIARTRYARGEISKEQYEEICKALGS